MSTDSISSNGGPFVYRATIQRPDSISITGATNVVSIGSIGYLKSASGGWTIVHHQGESANFMDDMLLYINILKRATSVTRNGETFTIPPVEAANLLITTHLSQYQEVSDVTYTATVANGIIRSVTLRAGGASPFSATVQVTKLDTSPSVTAP